MAGDDGIRLGVGLIAALRDLDPRASKPTLRLTLQDAAGNTHMALDLTTAGVAAAIAALENSTSLGAGIDPLLIAQLEDHFATVDPDSYLTDVFNSPDAEASLAAYEQLVTDEWDGGAP
ncbi:hypothetical protein AB0E67_27235 [Streptomyces sp. NPDC032161]|uniref:hypothetical protein n=1 Tax=unclassified Streptomyces TaxID=2593676 RepID=UPI00340AD536